MIDVSTYYGSVAFCAGHVKCVNPLNGEGGK
jgi:hypothetical protein